VSSQSLEARMTPPALARTAPLRPTDQRFGQETLEVTCDRRRRRAIKLEPAMLDPSTPERTHRGPGCSLAR
jgi:hypothetical protein